MAAQERIGNPAASHKGLRVQAFATLDVWREWLKQHGGVAPGLWLRLAKKGASWASLSRAEAVEGALAFGWIDGQLQPWDEASWLVRFTPRGAKSRWSQINCQTAERLIADGLMAPAGLAQVEAAKADGRWDAAYAPQAKAEVPPDLQAALDAEPKAAAFFATLTGANRFAILYRTQDAKTAATRAARIAKFVGMLARGEVIHPTRRKGG